MKCPSCGWELPDQSKFCGNCGSIVQKAPEAPSAGTGPQPTGLPSFEVPAADASTNAGVSASLGSAPVSRPDAKAAAAPAVASAVPVSAAAQPAPQPTAASMSQGDVPAKKKGKGGLAVFLIVIILLAVGGAAYAVNRFVTPIFSGAGGEAKSSALFFQEDSLLVARAAKSQILAEDVAEYDGWSTLCYTSDGKEFVFYDSIEGNLAKLLIGAPGGKAEEIDSDVIVGQILVKPSAVMYQRMDKDKTILCLYRGGKPIELAENDAGSGSWCCSDDGTFASYVVFDDEGKSVGHYYYKGEDYELSEYTAVIYVSPNGKAAYAADFGDTYDNVADTLYALVDFANTEAVEVGEDVGAVLIDASNNACAFLADYDPADGNGDLCYAKWANEAVEIDTKVTDIRYLAAGSYLTSAGSLYGGAAYNISPSFGGEIYYVRKDALCVTPFKAERTLKLVGDVNDVNSGFTAVNGVLYWQEDSDIMSYKVGSLKEPGSWKPDAAEDGFFIMKNKLVLSTEDNELYTQPFGSDGDATSIMEDADEYSFSGLSPDEKFIYFMDGDELLFISIKGGKQVSVMDDIENLCMTTDGIYMLADYDAEDGGEVFFVGYGKSKPVSVAKDILRITTVSYLS